MPRIRTIKPEFWSDEKLAPMPVATRLAFLALISMSDDCGRLLDSVPQIVAFMHPHLDDDEFARASRECRESLARLSEAGRIVRGTTASGQRVVQIVNWERHQKVDHPNTRAALPEVVAVREVTEIRESLARDSREPREEFASDSRDDLRPTTSTSDLRPTSSPRRAKKPRVSVPVENWVADGVEWWVPNIGAITHGQFGKLAKPVYTAKGLDAIKAPALRYFGPHGKKGFRSAADFFATFAEWERETPVVRPIRPEPQPESPSERLARMGAL